MHMMTARAYMTCKMCNICSVLSEDATKTQTFEAMSYALNRCFSKQDHFKVGNALVRNFLHSRSLGFVLY